MTLSLRILKRHILFMCIWNVQNCNFVDIRWKCQLFPTISNACGRVGPSTCWVGYWAGIPDHHLHVTTKMLIPSLKVDVIRHIFHFHTVTLWTYNVCGAGVLPLLGVRRGWLSPSETAQSPLVRVLLSAGICFGGGVILTSCLTHMLPDVNEVSIIKLTVHMWMEL